MVFFSVEEVLAIAVQASFRALIFKDINGVLTYAGSSLQGHRPVIATKLSANNHGRVRSHSERIVPEALVDTLQGALQQEAQERLLEESRLRRERQAEETRAAAEQEL